MTLIDLIILGCATWYTSFVLSQLKGPLGVFKGVREQPYFKVMDCIYCLSFWVAIGLYLLMYNDIEEPVYILGICGAAHMLASYTGANYGNEDNG